MHTREQPANLSPKQQYASPTSDNLTLAASGSGDIAEMTESLGDEAAYAYVRMKLGNDEYSERVKFVFVIWQGPSFPLPCLSYPPFAPLPPSLHKINVSSTRRSCC